jgi:hypothetical protein
LVAISQRIKLDKSEYRMSKSESAVNESLDADLRWNHGNIEQGQECGKIRISNVEIRKAFKSG